MIQSTLFLESKVRIAYLENERGNQFFEGYFIENFYYQGE